MKKFSPKVEFIVISWIVFFTACASAYLFTERDGAPAAYDSSAEIMNTYIDQHIYAESDSEKIALLAIESAGEIEAQLSWRNSQSDVWAINDNTKRFVYISDNTADILATLLKVAEVSEGAYDPTTLSLVKAWGFDSAVQYVPENSGIKEALKNVGYKNLEVDTQYNKAKIESKTAALYLESIMRGAACDAVLDTYKSNNVNGGLVAIGECIGAFGSKGTAPEQPWSIELRDPNGDSEDVLGVLRFIQGCVATKGIYQSFFIEEESVYHSILDSKTSRPCSNDIICATVVSDSAVLSEAAAYACVAAGKEKIPQIAADLGVQVIAVDNQNNIYLTSALFSSFTLEAEGYSVSAF